MWIGGKNNFTGVSQIYIEGNGKKLDTITAYVSFDV